MNEVMHYNGYTGLKITQDDKAVWKILKDSEFIRYMEYHNTSIENLRNFNKLIDHLVGNKKIPWEK